MSERQHEARIPSFHNSFRSTLSPLLAFAGKNYNQMTPAAGLECVKELPGYVVMDAFGPDYSWPLAVHMTPSDVGFHCTNKARRI